VVAERQFLHLSMAFVLQYGMGVVASLWSPDAFGRLPVLAYRAAFALPLLLESIALVWFVVSLIGQRRRNYRAGRGGPVVSTEAGR
jgi:hypothetical protein